MSSTSSQVDAQLLACSSSSDSNSNGNMSNGPADSNTRPPSFHAIGASPQSLSPPSIRQLFSNYFHVFLILLVRALLRRVNTNQLRPVLSFVGLSAVLAEAENGGVGDVSRGLLDPVQAAADVIISRGLPLLPPRHESDKERLTIVLDLDETLVCAYNSSMLPPSVHSSAVTGGVRWFQLDCSSNEKTTDGRPRTSNVTVYERPGLQEFLARASMVGELVLFTAGLEGYARPLVDRIDPEGRISARLYRPATVTTRYREHVKDLSGLGRELQRTVIVDNNPFSFLLQPLNGIPCVPFTGEHAGDKQLLDVLLPLLEQLSSESDVRPMLHKKFRMPTWFRSRGIPASDWPE